MAASPQHRRLARLTRLERLRAIAHRQAMVAAGQAEGTLAQLQNLAARTDDLARTYAARTDADDGAALAHQGAFRAGLERIARSTAGEIDTARRIADTRAAEAAAAQRRRDAVSERVATQARAIARAHAAADTPLGARRPREENEHPREEEREDRPPLAEEPPSSPIYGPLHRDWHGS